MTTIDRDLEWRSRPRDFSSSAKKVMLSLSSIRARWRTLEQIEKLTGLDYEDMSSTLADLLRRGEVQGSYIRDTYEPIFGLVERVGDGGRNLPSTARIQQRARHLQKELSKRTNGNAAAAFKP